MSEVQDNISDLRFVMLSISILILLLMIAVCLSANIVDQYVLITLSVAWMSRQNAMWFSDALTNKMFIWDILYHVLIILFLGVSLQFLTSFDKRTKNTKDLN